MQVAMASCYPMQFNTSWVPDTDTGTGDTMDIQIFPEGSQGEQATSEEGMWLRPIKDLITGLCLKGESDEELGVWLGLWMSEGAADGGKGSRNLRREAWIPEEELGHILRPWEAEKQGSGKITEALQFQDPGRMGVSKVWMV